MHYNNIYNKNIKKKYFKMQIMITIARHNY